MNRKYYVTLLYFEQPSSNGAEAEGSNFRRPSMYDHVVWLRATEFVTVMHLGLASLQGLHQARRPTRRCLGGGGQIFHFLLSHCRIIRRRSAELANLSVIHPRDAARWMTVKSSFIVPFSIVHNAATRLTSQHETAQFSLSFDVPQNSRKLVAHTYVREGVNRSHSTPCPVITELISCTVHIR